MPQRTEDGATAVVFAILATVLMVTAAMSVDLGNAWARKRDVQTQVDLSALSAGHMLPAPSSNTALRAEIVDEVVAYLNSLNNKVPGQSPITAGAMVDGINGNGEVLFVDNPATATTDEGLEGTRLEVIAPPAHVNFGLGSIVVPDGTDVSATATVEIMSLIPPGQDMLPFWLPDGCPYGPGMADTGSGGPDGQEENYEPTETGNHTVDFEASVAEGSTESVSIALKQLPSGSTSGFIRFRLGASTIVDSSPATWPATSASDKSRTVSLQLDTSVTNTPGVWRVWAMLPTDEGDEYSRTSGTLTVEADAPDIVGCANSVEGNFGQLDSPRADENELQKALALNIAKGLDHQVVPFLDAPSDTCNTGANFIEGAQPDNQSRDGNNCITGSTGNDGPWMLKGFITGVEGEYGRLDARRGSTNASCGGRSDVEVEGIDINNDVLSCYLATGATLADIAQDDLTEETAANLLDPSVVESPRFVWVPVVYADERSEHAYQPIKTFVPGFITDESVAASKGASDATETNGVVVNPGTSLVSLQIFMFNELVLPIDERSRTTAYDPTKRSIVRLVN